MVIYGGISEDNKTLEDMCVLDLSDYTWSEADIKIKEDVKSKKTNQLMR